MAAVLFNDAVVIVAGVFRDHCANFTEFGARFYHINGFVETFLCHYAQALGVLGNVTHVIHAVGIAVPAILDDGDIDVQQIAVLQDFAV